MEVGDQAARDCQDLPIFRGFLSTDVFQQSIFPPYLFLQHRAVQSCVIVFQVSTTVQSSILNLRCVFSMKIFMDIGQRYRQLL